MPEPKAPVGSTEWYEAVEAEAQREFEAKRRKEKAAQGKGSVPSIRRKEVNQ